MNPFASSADVADRWRPLTASESSLADVLCSDASTVLRARFPGIDGQVTAGTMDVNILTIVVAGMVKRAMISGADDGVASHSESVGPYSQSRTFANPLQNVFLTAADLVLILGYQPSGMSGTFANTTVNYCGGGDGYVYGWGIDASDVVTNPDGSPYSP